jgi:hypothetical protein
VHPVMLLPFDHKSILETCGIWWVLPALSDHID